MQSQSQHRLEELKTEIQQTQGSVEATRNDLKWLSEELVLQAAKVNEGEEIFKNEEGSYNESSRQYNEFNLLVTRQHSKIGALKQELDFKNNQLNELKLQIENNTQQLSDSRQQIES